MQYPSQSSEGVKFPSKQDPYVSTQNSPRRWFSLITRHTCTKAHSPGPPVCLVSTSLLPPLLGRSGSWLRPQTSEHTYQVTQGAGQLFGNFKLPGCGEDVTFPMHEEIQGSPLHKLFHHDIYKHKNSHICNPTSIWDSTRPDSLTRAWLTDWYSA